MNVAKPHSSTIEADPGILMGEKHLSLLDFAVEAGRLFIAGITREEQKAAGQFMTPPQIAKHMADQLVASVDRRRVLLLEPSAGSGVLLAAAVEALLEKRFRPSLIEALLYEQDRRLIPNLHALCKRITGVCAASGVQFKFGIHIEDFLLSDLAIRGEPLDGLLTIANPPYFKLNRMTDERARHHSYAVHGQPNAYGLFMAATARLTPSNGRWCFIVPRSWMNGQYFKAVRLTILRHLTIDSLHAFESRQNSFEEDAVLQETVIAWASGRTARESGLKVLFTKSEGVFDLHRALAQTVPAERMFSGDGLMTIPLPSDVANLLDGWSARLSTYGLKVSTGPVVAFRCKEFIRAKSSKGTVPLLWMQHIGQQQVNWPILKKLEHIYATSANAWMLVANSPMVVMRRFSPKEDQRRVTCAPYLGTLPGAAIGLENHLNYIHRPSGRMSDSEVRGLSALLASSVVDCHLRAVAGSTQINASELRSLPLPSMKTIEAIGSRLSNLPALEEIDAAVEAELGTSAGSSKAAA